MVVEYEVVYKVDGVEKRKETFDVDEVKLMMGGLYYAMKKDSVNKRKDQYKVFRQKWFDLGGFTR